MSNIDALLEKADRARDLSTYERLGVIEGLAAHVRVLRDAAAEPPTHPAILVKIQKALDSQRDALWIIERIKEAMA